MSSQEGRTLNEISSKLGAIKAMLDAEARTKRNLSQIAAEKCCMLVPGIEATYDNMPTALVSGPRFIQVRSVDPHEQTVVCSYQHEMEVPSLLGGPKTKWEYRTITLPAFVVQPHRKAVRDDITEQ